MPNIFLIILVFLTGFAVEALGIAISVIGVSAMFGGNLIVIAFILALDIGKVVTISATYQHWERIPKVMKCYAISAITITMIISSAGAAGYFSGQFQKAMQGNNEGQIKITAMQDQIAKYESRLKQIDAQIANIPTNHTTARIRAMKAFEAERAAVTAKINQIETELPQLQMTQLETSAKAGPILAIATALDMPVNHVLNFVIGLLILVFNPFAVFLVLLGNFLVKERTKAKSSAVVESTVVTTPVAKSAIISDVVTDAPVAEVVEPVVEEAVAEIVEVAEPVVEEAVAEVAEPVVEEVVETAVEPVVETVVKSDATIEEVPLVEAPLVERHITRVSHLPTYRSALNDPALDAIDDGTVIDTNM